MVLLDGSVLYPLGAPQGTLGKTAQGGGSSGRRRCVCLLPGDPLGDPRGSNNSLNNSNNRSKTPYNRSIKCRKMQIPPTPSLMSPGAWASQSSPQMVRRWLGWTVASQQAFSAFSAHFLHYRMGLGRLYEKDLENLHFPHVLPLLCAFGGCLVVRMLSGIAGNVVDRLYKPFARKPWLTVYRAHAGAPKRM